MRYTIKILHQLKWFLIPYFILITFVVFILIIYTKADIHIWCNQHNSPFFDYFFKFITFLGDGIFIVLLAILLLLWQVRAGLLVFSTYAISGILVQILKRIAHTPRPKVFFEGVYDLHFVEGVKLYATNSFPSGHAASAFAMLFCFAVYTKNKWVQGFLFAVASTIAYSRIYLSQHFLIDVTVGSVFGIIVAVVCASILQNKQQDWLNRPIYKAFKNNTN